MNDTKEKIKLIEYDEKLLKEDVSFPLKEQGMSYLFDAKGNMIAMFNDDGVALKSVLFGEYRVAETNTGEFELVDGDFIRKSDGAVIGLVRGWGRIQYKNTPEKRQDNIAAFLLGLLNEEVAKDGKNTDG